MKQRKHPQALWTIAFGKLWDTFSYFGTQTILALYFIHVFHLSHTTSYMLYGAYAAFAFSAPTLGGIISDKWLGIKRSLILGLTLDIVGNLILMSFHQYIFCLGLATTIIGAGLYKSNSTALTGSIYKNGDPNKELGFTWFYLAINVGGTLGPLLYGYIAYKAGWNYGFLCSAIGILIGAIWLFANWKQFKLTNNQQQSKKQIPIYLLVVVLCFILSLPFYFPSSISPIVLIIFFCSLSYIAFAMKKHVSTELRHLKAILLICFFSMFYFAAGLQIGTTITLFIQSKINTGIITTSLPASSFSMLYPLFVLLLAPFATWLWKHLRSRDIHLSVTFKLSVGIALAGIGIAVFALGSITSYVLTCVVIGNALLSAGELVLTPAAYTSISDLSPNTMKSTMMGCWLLFNAMGGYFSSWLARISEWLPHITPSQHAYTSQFTYIALFTLLIAALVATAIPKMRKMMA